jgi:predicted dehydrogenase
MGISLGLLGLGSFGRCFAGLFKAHPLVDRIALCDREANLLKPYAGDPAWRAKLRPADCYTDYEALLRAKLDAIAIITQPWLHAPQALAALEAGASVYSAVPVIMLPNGREMLDWCERLVTAVKRTGRHYMLGETTYFRPEAMYARRRAAAGAFGHFTYAEGEYFHSFDEPGCDLREVQKQRHASAVGREWLAQAEAYRKKGVRSGPMHYPTHSVSGPLCVMKTHATKVACFGQAPFSSDAFFDDSGIANETAIFSLANGAVMRICEHRECAVSREIFRIYGDRCAFENGRWIDKFDRSKNESPTVEQMRDPLPEEVVAGFRESDPNSDIYGGHGGSHAYLVHEFVDAVARNRSPAIDVWQAARYMAAGVMAHQSALRGGERLDVPDWGDGC